jgi:ATP-dependent RNA helicase DeaD
VTSIAPPEPGPAGPKASPLPLTVVTVCRNSVRTLAPVLESVRGLAGEIVAVDSGSTDGTIELCRSHGARVIETEWMGFVRTKQFALEQATRPWALHLDSDEPVTPELADAIRGLIEGGGPADSGIAGARVRRVVWYRGEPLLHAWQPEWRTRLVRTELVRAGRARWAGIDPHDYLEIDGDAGRVVELAGVLRHDSFETFDEHLGKQLGHARTAAQALHTMGRRSSAWKLMTSPVGAFAKQILAKQAWRDGRAGWLAAGTAAAGTLMKHMILLEMDLGEQAAKTRGSGGEHAPDRGGGYSSGVDGRSTGTGERRDQVPGRPPAVLPAGRGAEHPGKAPVSDPSVEQDTGTESPERDPSVEADAGSGLSPEADAAARNPESGEGPGEGTGEGGKKKRKRRRRRRKGKGEGDGGKADASRDDDADDDGGDDDDRAVSKTLRNVTPLSEEAKAHVFNLENSFKDLGLNDDLIRALADAGWEHPTKIQAELIPPVLEGKHVLGQAKTGSGKTASFGLPVLHRVEKGIAMQVLILAPTRELAVQIRDDIDQLGRYTGLKTCAVYGGQKIHTQADRLAKGPEIIVGTPGRVLDMIQRGYLRLDGVRMAVLDEVDRMFDIGFRDDIKRILSMCPKSKQTVFVSATMTDEIERLAKSHMTDPLRLNVSSGSLTVEMVTQHHISVQPWDKKRMLAHMLTHEEPDLTLVFCRMKRTVDDVVRYLGKKHIHAHALHGDMSQGKRNQTMRNFRHGELNVLVASDLASRGLDVEGITHVVNYDLPEDPDIYVHRIGRTARAGREGIAWSLVTPEQGSLLTEIELLINAEIPERKYPDFEPRPQPDDWRPEPKGGRPIAEVTGVEAPKSRLKDEDNIPAADKLSAEELAKKFPGGVVPKKMPGKRLRGKIRTRGR